MRFPYQIHPKKILKTKNLNICIKTPQEMFGFDELMVDEINSRQNNCVCISN
jgi:hypothetical protein